MWLWMLCLRKKSILAGTEKEYSQSGVSNRKLHPKIITTSNNVIEPSSGAKGGDSTSVIIIGVAIINSTNWNIDYKRLAITNFRKSVISQSIRVKMNELKTVQNVSDLKGSL